MTNIDLEILEARINAVLDKKIPIYWHDTPERKKDCPSQRGIKNYQRQVLRHKMAMNNALISEYEQQLHIEPA